MAPLHRIEMPVPFAMRSVNAWLSLDEDGATLVDCGPRTPDGWEALVAGLHAHGVRPADVTRVLLTHAHVDHYGNLARLQRGNPSLRAFVHPADRGWIEDYEGGRRMRFDAYGPALERCGLDERDMRRLAKGYEILATMAEAAAVHGTLEPGTSVHVARADHEVIHVPGHSPGCVALHDPLDSTLLSGDVLLERVTTNAVCLADDERAALRDHRASLRRLAATDARHVLPGHRDPFDDARKIAEEHETNIAARGERVFGLLTTEPQSVRSLVRGLFRELEVDLFLACSELLGHLRELERAGRAVERSDGRWTAPR
ncbi:MAG TPA: MBL fold metallo-hydrolase [Candidatus Thermoplasmatota archaeon]|nr:MBL fold metallo-hydrolase [Candidatus Thermoplasmatota archaeon]